MRRLPLLLLLAPLVALAASCGGGGSSGSVGKDDAAVVDGTPITQAELDRRVHEAKCSAKIQKQTFPAAGSSAYQSIQSQILQSLVQRVELAQQAPKLGVSVSDKQVDSQLTQLKKQYFGGSEKRYQTELKRQCVTDAEVRGDVRANLLSAAIAKKLTAGIKVSDAETRSYYDLHRPTYTQPQTRVVRHILVSTKSLADRLYTRLEAGADFATLAKKYSTDTSSKGQGGRLTIQRGQTVAPFDRVAFTLKTGQISKPVHTQYGWHIIQALGNTKGRTSTPFAQVKGSIRQQLLQQKRSAAVQKWLDGVTKTYASKISYATGLAPPTTSTTATTTG